MSPVYLNPQQSSSIIPNYLERKGDQQQQLSGLPTIMGYVHDHHVTNSNNTIYFSGSSLDNHHHHHATTQFLAMDNYSRCTQDKVVEKLILSHDHKPIIYPFDQGNHKINDIISDNNTNKKCKPASKLRIVQTAKSKKMIIGDSKVVSHHRQTNLYRNTSSSSSSHDTNGIRMCTDCHTTTTPLWRSGPQGPKSLCNACGIRQRKARRAAAAAAAAMAAATATATTTITATAPGSGFGKETSSTSSAIVELPKLVVEDTASENTLPLKKRSKTFNAYTNNNTNTNTTTNNNSFEEFAWSPRMKNREFPKDEEEGAMLLMALSCGLACSS